MKFYSVMRLQFIIIIVKHYVFDTAYCLYIDEQHL